MTTTIQAIFRNGVFEPNEPIDVRNGEAVTLDVHRQNLTTEPDWLKNLREGREQLAAKYGLFPDSTLSIAEDRLRDI